jgi:hypothetical protein
MKLLLTIEKDKGKLWGRITYKRNLITDYASSIGALEKKMTKPAERFSWCQQSSVFT